MDNPCLDGHIFYYLRKQESNCKERKLSEITEIRGNKFGTHDAMFEVIHPIKVYFNLCLICICLRFQNSARNGKLRHSINHGPSMFLSLSLSYSLIIIFIIKLRKKTDVSNWYAYTGGGVGVRRGGVIYKLTGSK